MESLKMFVDRVEGDRVILLCSDGQTLNVRRSLLPAAAEGDEVSVTLRLKGRAAADGIRRLYEQLGVDDEG